MGRKQASSMRSIATLCFCLMNLACFVACGSSSASGGGNGGNPVPTITSLSPTSIGAGGLGLTLTVTGAGFVSSSAVEWNGSARTTIFVSSTELQAQIGAVDIATGGSATITVASPPPGGGLSSGATFTVNSNAGLTITSLSPNSALAGSQVPTLTVNGTGFVSGSQVQWNYIARSTTFVSSSELQAALYGDDTSNAAQIAVTVMNPGAATSPAATFSITDPVPAITSIGPTSAQAGSSGFTLNVVGTNFVSSSVVQWNGAPLAATYYGGIQLMAAVPDSDLVTPGTVAVTVANPSPGGGTSAASTFSVIAAGAYTLTTVNQASNDLLWDPVNQVIYLSVPSAATANENTISVLNPTTGSIVSSQFAGSEPDVLALSANSQYLYCGIDGSYSVQRFTLPSLATDINYSLGASSTYGSYFALDLQAAPADAHTTSVTLGSTQVSPQAEGGIVIYDDATARPTVAPGFGTYGGSLFDSLQWGSDDTILYASNNEDGAFDFYTLTVNTTGVVLDQDYPYDFPGYNFRIHYDPGTQLLYGDGGSVVVPSTGLTAGTFQASGLMVPDSTLNAAFFLGQTQSQVGGSDFTVESFDLTRFTPVAEITVPNVIGKPLRLIRWGQNGLAVNTDRGKVYVISGSFVGAVARNQGKRNAQFDLPPVRRTWRIPLRATARK
jgi:hypothetical protein